MLSYSICAAIVVVIAVTTVTTNMIAILVVIILMLLWIVCNRAESFRSCGYCDKVIPAQRLSVLNPFIWPYSAAADPDAAYHMSLTLAPEEVPLTHLSTPDHVELIN
jgi:hypothetical protein